MNRNPDKRLKNLRVGGFRDMNVQSYTQDGASDVERVGTCCYPTEVLIRGEWRCCGCGRAV